MSLNFCVHAVHKLLAISLTQISSQTYFSILRSLRLAVIRKSYFSGFNGRLIKVNSCAECKFLGIRCIRHSSKLSHLSLLIRGKSFSSSLKPNVMFIVALTTRSAQLNSVIFQLKFPQISL